MSDNQELLTQENREAAHKVALDLHRRAFLGRLSSQHGIEPETQKEAEALLDLGVQLLQEDSGAAFDKAAGTSDYGDGPYAQIKHAFDQVRSDQIPGFEDLFPAESLFRNKTAASGMGNDFPPAVIDSAYELAGQLACRPDVYQAAIVKQAEFAAIAEQQNAAESN